MNLKQRKFFDTCDAAMMCEKAAMMVFMDKSVL